MLSGGAAALGGLAATAGMTYANSGQSRSESALLSLRNLQRNKTLLKIVGVGSSYDNMLITKTQVKKVKGVKARRRSLWKCNK
jgi:predicted membrane metal-binding protein